MEDTLVQKLDFLSLNWLTENWDAVMKEATKGKRSYSRFLSEIVDEEYHHKSERKRNARLKAAKIPEMLVMETFPFTKQPKLKKRMAMELYDSMSYIHQNQTLCLIGPTGCGKSGLATAYLMHAINQGYRGLYISFSELITMLYQSAADYSERKVLKRLALLDCLLIDELGYRIVNKDEAGLFFELMKMRHKKACTIITTQLGFDEWRSFLRDKHLVMAIVDRITENCTVFNMKDCISIRPKNIKQAAEK